MINSLKAHIRKHEENLLFLKRLICNPKMLGAIAPSSHKLSNFICKNISFNNDDYMIEIGAGTGRFTKTLLNKGLSAKKLCVVELDPEMCSYLRKNFPHVHIIEGDASHLPHLIPKEFHGSVSTIISGIPLINLPFHKIEQIVKACFALMHPKGRFLQYTYAPISPLPAKKLGLKKKKLGYVFHNLPPAIIWEYQKK